MRIYTWEYHVIYYTYGGSMNIIMAFGLFIQPLITRNKNEYFIAIILD